MAAFDRRYPGAFRVRGRARMPCPPARPMPTTSVIAPMRPIIRLVSPPGPGGMMGRDAMSVSASVLTQPTATFPLLRETELRRFLTDLQLRELERYCRASARRRGVTVFRQGEPADSFYLVAEGSVELRARPPGRRVYRTVEVVRPTCSFGDEAL